MLLIYDLYRVKCLCSVTVPMNSTLDLYLIYLLSAQFWYCVTLFLQSIRRKTTVNWEMFVNTMEQWFCPLLQQ